MSTIIKNFLVSLMMLMSTSVFSGTVTVNGDPCGVLAGSLTVDASGNIAFSTDGDCGTPTFNLQVTASGNGEISSDIGGMNVRGSTSTQAYLSTQIVVLTATEDAEETFNEDWTGCDSNPAPNTCSVAMGSAQAVSGSFTTVNTVQYQLNVAISGGSGTVSGNGISCPADCSGSYDDGAVVPLTATPSGGDVFVSWEDACSGSTCNVTMSQARSVTANFTTPAATHQLTVNVGGTGSGSVASFPAGISNCSGGGAGTCTAPFSDGSSVALTATPAGSDTVTWSGCTSLAGSTCNVTMTGVKAVDAIFTAAVAGGNYPVLDWPSIPQRTIRLRGDEVITYQVRTSAATTLGGQLSTAFTTGTAANRIVTISTTPGDFNTASLGKCVNSGSEVASVGWTQNPNPPFPFNIIGTCILSTDTTYYLNVKHTNCPANTVCEFYLSN